jgi:hypothetical protein
MHGGAILPGLGESLGPALLKWLDVKADLHVPLRASAICLADDLLEFASPGAHVLLPVVLPHLLECAMHAKPLLRHPAVYGLGVAAAHAGAGFDAHVPVASAVLARVLGQADARSEDNEFATDNAVSALVKLAKFRGAAVDGEAIMRAALEYLPIRGDAVEARLVHGWLVAGLRDMDPLWAGAGGARGKELLSALARALAAHEARQAGGGGGDEDDDEEEEEEELLFDVATLAALPKVAAAVKAGANAAAVAAVLATLKRRERDAMARVGF